MRRVAIAMLLAGCGSSPTATASDSGDTGLDSSSWGDASASSSGTPDPSTTGTSPTGAETSTTETPDDGSSTSSVSSAFITDPSGGGCGRKRPDGVMKHLTIECSVVDQDCCEGEACRAWANDGGDVWNATRCVPLDPRAGQAGDPCVVEGSAVSGIDSCDLGLMCWNVDPDSLEGTCAQYCGGDGEEPTCANPDETCNVSNEGDLPLCLPTCHPLGSDCAQGFGCYPGSQGDFVCVREGDGVHIEGITHPYCPAGTFMPFPDRVEGCSGDAPCCASFCDQRELSPCGAEAECLPYFDPAELNPLGYCSVAI